MVKIRPVIILLVVTALAWTGVIAVQAHAMLIRSIPEANATLASSPAQVELFFSEPVAANLSKISVLDLNGKRVGSGISHLDPVDATHLVAPLPNLDDGVYTVVWSAVSATDDHQTTGSFPFAVGKVDPNAIGMSAIPAAAAQPVPLGEMMTKGFLYIAAAAITGGLLFTFLVWRPACRNARIPVGNLQRYNKISRRLTMVALIILATADMLRLMLQAGTASGSFVAWPWQPAFTSSLLGTRVGVLGIVQLILAGVLALLLLPPQNKWNRWAGLAASLALLATFSLEGHAAGNPRPFLPMLADWVHMTGVSVWVGGLFSFLAAMWTIRSLETEARTRLTAVMIPHFTRLAMASVAVLAITGVYAAFLNVGTLNALLTTPYGQALLVKLVIAAPMLALGGINFLFTTPSMNRAAARPGGSPAAVDHFRFLLSGEVLLGVTILIWVGVFTTLPPAKVPGMTAGYQGVTRADDLSIQLNIDPYHPGINTFNVSITSGGKPVTDAKDVSLEFTNLSGMVPASKAAMSSQGNGVYRLQGGYLGMPDKWDVKAVVIRPNKFDAYGDFKLDMTQMAGP